MAIRLSVFIDETGSLNNPHENSPYGSGFCYLPPENTDHVQDLLRAEGLDRIHISKMKSKEQKVRVAEQLGNLKLENFGLRGGAVIRSSPDHANSFIMNEVYKNILSDPLMAVYAAENSNRTKRKPIVSVNDIFPDIAKCPRITEFMILNTRYPVFSMLQEYGSVDDFEIELNFSSIGDPIKYKQKIEFAFPGGRESLLTFVRLLHKEGIIDRDPENFIKVSAKVVVDAGNLFGVSDLIASIGYMSISANNEKRSLASAMHANVKGLFPSNHHTHPQEALKGIFVL